MENQKSAETKNEDTHDFVFLEKEPRKRENHLKVETNNQLSKEDIINTVTKQQNHTKSYEQYYFDQRKLEAQLDQACIGFFFTVSIIGIVMYTFF